MKRPNIEEAINKTLEKYQVTIEELIEMYPTNKEGIVMVDGIYWHDYFYVPDEVQFEVVEKWQKKYKRKFGLCWLEMPSCSKASDYCNKMIDSLTLINNRNELLKVWNLI
jgi:hypothetical protein